MRRQKKRRTPDGQRHENWYKYDYWRTTQETKVTESAPAKIIAGGNITLSGGALWNQDSQIVAGQQLNAQIEQGNLHNQETPGTRIIQDVGCAAEKPEGGCYADKAEAQRAGVDATDWNSQSVPGLHSYWRNHDKGRDSTGHSRQDYVPAPEVSHDISLGSLVYREYAAVSPGNRAGRRQGLQLNDRIALTAEQVARLTSATSSGWKAVASPCRTAAGKPYWHRRCTYAYVPATSTATAHCSPAASPHSM